MTFSRPEKLDTFLRCLTKTIIYKLELKSLHTHSVKVELKNVRRMKHLFSKLLRVSWEKTIIEYLIVENYRKLRASVECHVV